MNILFVNYGDFTTNSLNHISGFANSLCGTGHGCAVVVPDNKETIVHIGNHSFIPATYAEALVNPALFPDGRPADVIHAWTPREVVRRFVLAYQKVIATPARLVVHLEDNEAFLLESYTGKATGELINASCEKTDEWLVDALSHPLRHRSFLEIADAATLIVERLRELVPAGIPATVIFPGIDFSHYHPQPPDGQLRRELGIADGDYVIAFTGSNTFANTEEICDLYDAVALLNERGIPTWLVRTGFDAAAVADARGQSDSPTHVINLGFIEKTKLPGILALADVLVQPGRPGSFNDFRLPSKVPEFLAMGKATILPPTNLALLLEDGHDSVFLRSGTAEEIADLCSALFDQPERRAILGQNAEAFARAHFDMDENSRRLAALYEEVLAKVSRADWQLGRGTSLSDVTLLVNLYRRTAAGLKESDARIDFDLLERLVRELEERLALALKRQPMTDAQLDDMVTREQLTANHVKNLEELVARLREELQASIAAKDLEIEVFRRSRSWQLTRPLRSIGAALRNVRMSRRFRDAK